jgi:choline-sulfatase
MTVVFNIALLILAGIMMGCSVVPMKYATKRKWENSWLLYVVFAQVLLPLIFIALTVPHAWEKFRSATPSAVASATLFGLGWGIGNVLGGIGYAMLGVGLGLSIALGLTASTGSLVPPAGLFPERLKSPSAVALDVGVVIMLAGVALSSQAGRLRQAHQDAGEISNSADLKAFGKGNFRNGLLICICLFWCLLVVTTGVEAHASANSPSVILISVDTLRADHLSCYGYRANRTPHIDTLVRGGTLFYQISAQVPLTLPSHASLLTSTYPFSNGIEDNGQQLGPNAVTLATVLKSQGYRTAAFVGSFVLDRRFGLSEGFDLYDSPFDVNRERVADPGDVRRRGEEVVHAATHWIEKNSSAPFFVFLHLYDLHTPYNLSTRVPERVGMSDYDSELAYVDEAIGTFLDFLAQRGLRQKVLLVFASDHGEGLGEHEEGAHGYFIYQTTLWVPLIIHWPSGAGSVAARVNQPASLLDVAPTILSYLGVPQPSQFQGRTLIGLVQGKPPSRAEGVYSENLYGQEHFGTAALRSLRLGRYKYIDAPRAEFYDLQDDPGETTNVYASQRDLAASYRDRLLLIRSQFRTEKSSSQRMSPEVQARLRSLGYISGPTTSAVSGLRSEVDGSAPDPKDRIATYERFGYALRLATDGHLNESCEILTQLLNQDTGLIDVRLTLGVNLQELNQHTDAVQQFLQILKGDPLNVLAHFDLGLSYVVLGRLEDAIREFQATLAIAPYYTRAEEELGKIFLKQGEYQKAQSHFEHLLTIAPNDYDAHYTLGALAIRDGHVDNALRELGAALRAKPQSAEAHNALGSLYLLRGDLDEAQREFGEAVRYEPSFAQAHYNLGLVFQKRLENDKAAKEFRMALQEDPEFRVARDALDRLGNQHITK